MEKKADRRQPTETDLRFPSGQWRGHWIQRGRRGEMQLYLEFRAGVLSGVGRDHVGGFTLGGTYDVENGKTVCVKQYLRGHRVDYRGWAEGYQNGIWGVWDIPQIPDRGGWHIWPRRGGESTDRHKHAEGPVLESEVPF